MFFRATDQNKTIAEKAVSEPPSPYVTMFNLQKMDDIQVDKTKPQEKVIHVLHIKIKKQDS